MSPISIPGKVTLARHDSDVVNYIAAVEAADGQSLEPSIKFAYNVFILGCKSDGIWDAIKASCILAGARTLAGALVPLKGTAPTNNNFVAADYNRETGLVGDGSTKYLDSNRNNNADPQDNAHVSVWISSTNGASKVYINAGSYQSGARGLAQYNGRPEFFCNSLYSYQPLQSTPSNMSFMGTSRANGSTINIRVNNISDSSSSGSVTPSNSNLFVFRWNGSGNPNFSDARLSFYSIGESLDLALLDARVTTLMSDIGAAIP